MYDWDVRLLKGGGFEWFVLLPLSSTICWCTLDFSWFHWFTIALANSETQVDSFGRSIYFLEFNLFQYGAILPDHAARSEGKIVEDLYTWEQTESQKESSNSSKRHQKVNPAEKNFSFVANYWPCQVLNIDVHISFLGGLRIGDFGQFIDIIDSVEATQFALPTVHDLGDVGGIVGEAG